MKLVRRFVLILVTAVALLVSNTALSRHAAILIDTSNGDVLYELEANQSWYPASLTKLMTLYMAFSALESGRLHLNERLTISSHAAHQPTSKLGLRAWDTISAEDAILSVITRSANDAAVVLAERLAGTESQFAIKMTGTAHSLGMYGSHFMNATGLPHDWQTTTARDMAILALRIIKDFPQYYPYFAVDSLYYNGRFLRSTNKFVANYPGAEGMKTGYTCGSGYNLVATANQSGRRLIGVVLGGHSSYERYQHMFTMMDIGFSDEYGSYHHKNINTMNRSPVGSPPYQLPCGHRPSTHFASKHFEGIDDEDHHVRYVKRSGSVKRHFLPHRDIAAPRTITNVRIAGKSKTIVKQKVTRSGKKIIVVSNKTTRASSKTDKRALKTPVKGKHSAKPEKATQLATSKSKGYYVPGSSKTAKSAAKGSKKTKGYYKPESASKAVAVKSSSKSAKNKRSKSKS